MSDTWAIVVTGTGYVEALAVGQPASTPAGRAAYPAPDGCGIGWTRQGDGAFLDPYATKPPTKADLVAYAAARRLLVEEGGVTLPDGTRVKTDRESQGLVDRAVSLANLFPNDLIDFKATSGWVTLDAPTMLAIGKAVGLHVKGSFTRERAADAAIAAGTATTVADVDRILAGG